MIEPQIRCVELVELVTEWMEGELDDHTRAYVEEHLVICPHCTDYLRQLRATTATLGTIVRPGEAPPASARAALLAAFRSADGQ